jgi:hypothetical protein
MGIMNKLFVTIVFLSLFALIVVGFDLGYTGNIVKDDFNTQYVITHTTDTVNEYNQNYKGIPNFVKTLFGNEKINVIIKMNDNSEKQFNLITKDGKIANYSQGLMKSPSLKVETSEKTIDLIAQSKDPANALSEAIRNKNIIIEPTGIVSGVKVQSAKTFVIIKNWFS